LLDTGESRALYEMFADEGFGPQSGVFHRVLLWGMRRKQETRNFPVRFGQSGIDFGQISAGFGVCMIIGPVPDGDQALPWPLAFQPFQILDRVDALPGRVGVDEEVAREHIQGTIIGLPLPGVGQWNFNALVASPPDVATHVVPEQMTLIFHEHTDFAPLHGWHERSQRVFEFDPFF
jgi:hypothetical protein